ncbi:hypothetical protein EWM64_g3949 [Hericium alpestre]|uniref:Uncharacterized protein n=1 Tax=Hericium alpestre TaxID=135208 RepID=A0A4Z0A0S8_9AGAM|nr:hypothetical protein EWM64_g3949 [Hericium alpestre]
MATADVLRIPADALLARTLADEEILDLADPLRHLREDIEDPDVVVPFQPRSIQNEITDLVFTVPTAAPSNHNSHDIQYRTPASTIAIQLAVDASPGCGGIAWPAGEQILSSYIAQRGLNSLSGTNVIELGSGTGLVGLVAARLGAHVWITDQMPLVPFMQRNIALNGLSNNVAALELNWHVLSVQQFEITSSN